jgi:hypothetical protein
VWGGAVLIRWSQPRRREIMEPGVFIKGLIAFLCERIEGRRNVVPGFCASLRRGSKTGASHSMDRRQR